MSRLPIRVRVPHAARPLRVVGLLHDAHPLELVFVHADAASGAALVPALAAAGLAASPTTTTSMSTHVTATHAAVQDALGFALHQVECVSTGAHFYTHLVDVDVPDTLSPHVTTILGLSSFPVAKPHAFSRSAHARSVSPYFSAAQLRVAYGLPAADARTGAGITIGVIELGGGFSPGQFNPSHVRAISVNGGRNNPQDRLSSVEVLLDIGLIAGAAPGAVQNVYFAPNTDAGFYAAIQRAMQDRCAIVSISWAGPEVYWPLSTMRAYNALFAALSAANIAVFVASGDNGASDGLSGLNVEFPGSSPYVVCCGGTSVRANPATGALVSEVVWNGGSRSGATGGGFSAVFDKPAFQTGLMLSAKRGVPDVAANADPATGYVIAGMVVGGTSAVAPLYSGFLAHLYTLKPLTARMGSVAFNTAMYAAKSSKFADVTNGNNVVDAAGGFSAGRGWDACTGIGRLNAAFFQ